MEKEIISQLSRFIIPFTFNIPAEDTFTTLCNQIDHVTAPIGTNQPLWKPTNINDSECDLYSHIQRLTSNNMDAETERIGLSWILNPNLIKSQLPSILYQGKESHIQCDFTNLGLYLFCTGVGFIWYNISHHSQNVQETTLLNYTLKEISYNTKKLFLIENKSILLSSQGITTVADYEDVLPVLNKKGVFFSKINLPENLLNQANLKIIDKNDVLYADFESKEEVFSLSSFILDFLEPLSINSFFANRHSTSKSQEIMPDKALLFSHLLLSADSYKCEDSYHNTIQHLFRISKGYKSSYLPPNGFINHFEELSYIPFNNSYWYSSQEGCCNIAYLTGDSGSTDTFFKNTYPSKLESYFHLYIIVLYQHYGLLKISTEIAALPGAIDAYDNPEYQKYLERYNEDINLFCMKAIFMQASHISHQNDYYDYLRKTFRIAPTLEEIQDEISLVNDIVKRNMNKKAALKQEQTAGKLLILTIIGGIFVVLQTLNNVIGLYYIEDLPFSNCIGLYSYTGITFFSSIMIGLLLWLIIKKRNY